MPDRRALALLSLACVALAGCPRVHYDYHSEPDPRSREYELGPLDELSIVVWKNPELSSDVVIRPDGVLTLPLIGDVHATGRTPTDLKKEITRRLSDFVRIDEGVITIAVKSVNSYHYSVTGNIERAGVYTSKSYVTTVEALATAGGLNRFAGRMFYIVRHDRDGRRVRRIPIDYARITSADHADENLVILPDDVIVVP